MSVKQNILKKTFTGTVIGMVWHSLKVAKTVHEKNAN